MPRRFCVRFRIPQWVTAVSLDQFSGSPFDRVFTAAQSRALDQLAIERYAIPGIVLMKRAGRAAWEVLRACWPAIDSIAQRRCRPI